jgi:hypothetical protein
MPKWMAQRISKGPHIPPDLGRDIWFDRPIAGKLDEFFGKKKFTVELRQIELVTAMNEMFWFGHGLG